MTSRSGVRGPRLVQAFGALVLLVAVVLLVVTQHSGGREAAAATQESAPSAARTSGPDPSTTEAATGPSTGPVAGRRGGAASVPAPAGAATKVAPGLRPVRIAIPAIGVDSKLTDLGIAPDGTIQVPSVPAQAGWLDSSPAPGQRGPAVIAGHVDSTSGPAVFYKLSDLAVGDAIIVTRRDGHRVRFTVDGVAAYPKKHFPTRATYGPVPGPALRLITCGGSYVKSQGGYLDNVVVFAT